jgi:hypothetical protein
VLRALAAAAAGALALAVGPPVTAATLRVVPQRTSPGGVVSIRGTGCNSGDVVTLLSPAFSPGRSTRVGTLRTTARRNGSFRMQVTISKQKPRERYAVAARCDGRGLGALAWLRII